MTVKLLIKQHLGFLSLKGGCTGSSESTLVTMPHRWKSRVTAKLLLVVVFTNEEGQVERSKKMLSLNTPDRRQSKKFLTIDKLRRSKITRNSVLDCH